MPFWWNRNGLFAPTFCEKACFELRFGMYRISKDHRSCCERPSIAPRKGMFRSVEDGRRSAEKMRVVLRRWLTGVCKYRWELRIWGRGCLSLGISVKIRRGLSAVFKVPKPEGIGGWGWLPIGYVIGAWLRSFCAKHTTDHKLTMNDSSKESFCVQANTLVCSWIKTEI